MFRPIWKTLEQLFDGNAGLLAKMAGGGVVIGLLLVSGSLQRGEPVPIAAALLGILVIGPGAVLLLHSGERWFDSSTTRLGSVLRGIVFFCGLLILLAIVVAIFVLIEIVHL